MFSFNVLRWEPIQALFVPLENNLDPSSSPVNNYGTAVRARTGPSSGCMNGRKMGILESRSGPSEEPTESADVAVQSLRRVR